MNTGIRGTFVLSWSQIEVDGLFDQPVSALCAGAVWTRHGPSTRVDGPRDLLTLQLSEDDRELRRRAGPKVRRMIGAPEAEAPVELAATPLPQSFVLTDGRQSYTARLAGSARTGAQMLVFVDELPPEGRPLWVVSTHLDPRPARGKADGGMICFTPGTVITTPMGPRRIETLREGEKVSTRDGGAQEILWMGMRRISGARLSLEPALRPVRISEGAFGIRRPDQSLLVSPDHRLLVQGAAARALFNSDEVLVTARDLVNGRTIAPVSGLREVTYIHMMLPDHHVIWANRIETESFHPAGAHFDALDPADRDRLLAGAPRLAENPFSYGPHARRALTAPEAAILLRDVA